jgi:hypothetical protein
MPRQARIQYPGEFPGIAPGGWVTSVKATLLIFFAVFVSGCSSTLSQQKKEILGEIEAQYYWGRGTFLMRNAPIPGSPESWRKQASDPAANREERRLASALLFGAFVHPGFDSKKMKEALGNAPWLDECRLKTVFATGGNWFWFENGVHYELQFFPERNYDPSWAMYFSVSLDVPAENQRLEEIGLDFLRGKLTHSRAKVTEFVLVYPMPGCENWSHVEERHSRRGVGVKFQPSRWFGQ